MALHPCEFIFRMCNSLFRFFISDNFFDFFNFCHVFRFEIIPVLFACVLIGLTRWLQVLHIRLLGNPWVSACLFDWLSFGRIHMRLIGEFVQMIFGTIHICIFDVASFVLLDVRLRLSWNLGPAFFFIIIITVIAIHVPLSSFGHLTSIITYFEHLLFCQLGDLVTPKNLCFFYFIHRATIRYIY